MSGQHDATAAMNHDSFPMNSPAPAMNPAASTPQPEQHFQTPFTPDAAAGFRQASSPPPYPNLPGGNIILNQPGNSTSNTRRRGRPRKYGPDGNMNILAAPQQPINVAVPQQQHQPQPQQPQIFPPQAAVQTEASPAVDGSASPSSKKSRGRPRGSKNKKQRQGAQGSLGVGFVPHVINVETGEDVASKIMAICHNGPRAVCILSANGTISTVTLHQPATSGGTATYEGQFDILSLSGSFSLTEVSGQKSRKGTLSVALAGPDGSVLGGLVAGLLIAASPAQIIVGSFLPDDQKEDPCSNTLRVNTGGAGASSSPSRGTLSESSGGPASPLNMSSGGFNNIPQGMAGLPWK